MTPASERALAERLLRSPDLAGELDPPPPTRVGRYEVLAPLGQGATSDVWRARDPLLGREVALKVLLAAAPDALARFQQEVQVLAALSHPHIVPIHDAGVEEGRPWFVMELVEGGPLEPERLTPEALARTLEAVARALAAAHARGVVHRDLKPQNLLVDPRGPRIADFGVAKLQASEGAPEAGALVGTLPWMAPEQLRGEPDVGPPADVWALGVILYQGLTGQLPFAAGRLEELQALTLSGPRPPRSLQPAVPPRLEELTLRALTPDPARRPSALELAAGLAELAAPAPRRAPRRVATGLALLALAAGAGLLLRDAGVEARVDTARAAIERAVVEGQRPALELQADALEQLLAEPLRPPERHAALAALALARHELGRRAAARRALEEALLVPGPHTAECRLTRARLTAEEAVLARLRGEHELADARAARLEAELAALDEQPPPPALRGLQQGLHALVPHLWRGDDGDDEPAFPEGDEPELQLLAGEARLLAGDVLVATSLLVRARDQRPTRAAPRGALALAGGGSRAQLAAALGATELDPELGGPVLGHLLRSALLGELGGGPALERASQERARALLREGEEAEQEVARASLELFLGADDLNALEAAQERLEDLAESGVELVGLEVSLALCELLRARALEHAGQARASGEARDAAAERVEQLLQAGVEHPHVVALEELTEH